MTSGVGGGSSVAPETMELLNKQGRRLKKIF